MIAHTYARGTDGTSGYVSSGERVVVTSDGGPTDGPRCPAFTCRSISDLPSVWSELVGDIVSCAVDACLLYTSPSPRD